jgi:transcriptional regulator
MARANPQWERAAGQEVLAIFQGPHAYISPRWYGATNVVPTWNYVAIHAYGPFEVIDNPQTTRALARLTVEHYEAAFDEPWQLSASLELLDELTRQIVAFRIPITRIEGKWKLSQNHPLARRKQVIAGLRELGGDTARQVAGFETVPAGNERGEAELLDRLMQPAEVVLGEVFGNVHRGPA